MGEVLGLTVGLFEGDFEGEAVGEVLGLIEGFLDGDFEGDEVEQEIETGNCDKPQVFPSLTTDATWLSESSRRDTSAKDSRHKH
jgi:hypothetical protein